MNELFAFVRNDFVPASQASLLISDLSIQRGYGVFDFFKTLDRTPVFLNDHLDRFFHSADRLRLAVGKTREELRAILSTLQEKNGLPDCGTKLILTGGYSPDGYSLEKPNLVISQQPLPGPISGTMQKPIRLITYPHQRQLPDAKTIDYLMSIWLQPTIRAGGADDVLYYQNGIISECPRSNFFIVTAEDTLVTPARHILQGVIRSKVLELARGQFKTEQRDIRLEELYTAKEAFITSTTKHILPVVQVDDKVIGRGQREEDAGGKVSQWLNGELYRLVKERPQ